MQTAPKEIRSIAGAEGLSTDTEMVVDLLFTVRVDCSKWLQSRRLSVQLLRAHPPDVVPEGQAEDKLAHESSTVQLAVRVPLDNLLKPRRYHKFAPFIRLRQCQ
jgi:hypothetical protein